MNLKEYSKLSKDSKRTIIIMVRNGLIVYTVCDTDELECSEIGDMIILYLNENIKDKEKGH